MSDPNTGNTPGMVMNSLPTNQATFYLQQLTYWQNAVTRLDTLYNSLSLSTLDEYEQRAGDGMNKGKRKSLEAVGSELDKAMNRYRFYFQKIYGRGLMTVRMRRKG